MIIAYNNYRELCARIFAVLIAVAIPTSTTLTDVFTILAVVFMLASGHYRKNFSLIGANKVAVTCWVFYGLLIIGSLYSVASWGDSLSMLGKYKKLLLMPLLLPLLHDEEWRRYAMNAFLATMVVVLCLSYLQYYDIFTLASIHEGHVGKAAVFRGHIQANFLMAFATYLMLLRCFQSSRFRVLFIILALMMLYNVLFMSMGRSGYLVLAVLIALLWWQKLGWKGVVAAAVVIVALAAAAYQFSPEFKARIEVGVNDIKVYQQGKVDTSLGERFTFWKNSLYLIEVHPLIGSGAGSFSQRYAAIEPTPPKLIHNPHNEYLNITVQIGLVGLIALLYLFGVPLRYSGYLPETMRYTAQGIVFAIAAGSLFNSWLMDTVQGYTFAYFLILTYSAFDYQRTLFKD